MVCPLSDSTSGNAFPAERDRPLRAHQTAEMTAYALLRVEKYSSVRIQAQRLMTAVRAGDHTSPASYALLTLKSRENDRISLQHIRRLTHRIKR